MSEIGPGWRIRAEMGFDGGESEAPPPEASPAEDDEQSVVGERVGLALTGQTEPSQTGDSADSTSESGPTEAERDDAELARPVEGIAARDRAAFGQPGRLTEAPGNYEAPTTPQRQLAAPQWQGRGHNGPRVIAVANQKGGVGKTTTAVNFGAAAAELGHRVLIIDLDPQGNASTGLGINPRGLEASMYDVLLHDVPLDEAIEAAEVKNLFIAPANLDLAGAEIELVPAFSREMRLKNAIKAVADDFDLVLIDCPPSLGLLTVNAFAAANEVMVPIQCEYYALEGLGQLMRNVDLVRRNLNADLELSAIVLVMYDARTNLSAQVAGEVREHFGSKVCRAVIPRNIRLSEAPSFGQPITVFDPSSRGAIAYRDLAKEVMGEPS